MSGFSGFKGFSVQGFRVTGFTGLRVYGFRVGGIGFKVFLHQGPLILHFRVFSGFRLRL